MKRQFFYSPLPAPPAPPLPIINVGSIDELYDKVNDVDNEGRTIKLSPGVYRLDPSRGLLELQNNMSLIGQQGRRDLVVIDASNLIESNFNFSVQVTPLDSAKLEKGIIRLGKGTQSVQWMTFQNRSMTNKMRAFIETDIMDASTCKVTIAHNKMTGGSIGINIMNWWRDMNNRVVEADIDDNEILNNTNALFATGIQIQNSHGVTGATVKVSMNGNRIEGSGTGLFIMNAQCQGNKIYVQSHNDIIERNGLGIGIRAGHSQTRVIFPGNNNEVYFEAHGTKIRNNYSQNIPGEGPFFAGVLAMGGSRAQSPTGLIANNNKLDAKFFGCVIDGNSEKQIKVYGAYSADGSVVAGINNSANVSLHGVSAQATDDTKASHPAEVNPTNTAEVFRTP